MAAPTLLWLRRDLRLGDHPALAAALADGGPVIPVFVLDPVIEAAYGAAPLWRLEAGLAAYAAAVAAIGGRLVLRRGPALEALRALAAEVGARRVRWQRLYDPASIARDTAVKQGLREAGLEAESHSGWLLREPFALKTQAGDPFRVYSPFARAFFAAGPIGAPLPAPARWPAPERWPASDRLDAWRLGQAMNRGAAALATRVVAGEAAALARLAAFLAGPLGAYGADRDRLDRDGTSGMSPYLAVGEISPRTVWTAIERARVEQRGVEVGAQKFARELVWREFAWALLYHTPGMERDNWRSEWDAFPWSEDGDAEAALRWKQGRTGVDVVDAAMRELYVTGRMHNRARMLTASYLTKTLMTHWRVGEAWFRDCLVDWDPASNAMGWQWSAGSGPDAQPFFRIFNPETQAEKFDPEGAYRRRWLADLGGDLVSGGGPSADAAAFFAACPRSWGLDPEERRPAPAISLSEGRQRALAAYHTLRQT